MIKALISVQERDLNRTGRFQTSKLLKNMVTYTVHTHIIQPLLNHIGPFLLRKIHDLLVEPLSLANCKQSFLRNHIDVPSLQFSVLEA